MAPVTPAPTDNVAKPTKPEVSKSQKREEEEDDWLVGTLNRKKALSGSNSEAKTSKQEESLGLGEEVDLESIVRYCQSPHNKGNTMTEEAFFLSTE